METPNQTCGKHANIHNPNNPNYVGPHTPACKNPCAGKKK